MVEEWKEIKGFENYYISNLGRVKDNKNEILKQHKTKKTGYVFVNLNKDGNNHIKTVHRLVAIAFIPNPLGLSDVDHIDNNKLNNNVDNLQWLSHKDNVCKMRKDDNGNLIQKLKRTCYQKKLNNQKPTKKRCYIFNNIIFIKYEDIMNYLGKDKVNTRHFLFQNRIKRDYVLLLLNGNIQEIQDLKGNIINKEELKFYNKNDKYIKLKPMRLLKGKHNENEIWYFSTIRKAASFIDSADSNVNTSIKAHRKVKGWEFEWIESDDVISKYIDPKRQ